MLLCLFMFGTVLATPVDEFRALVHEGELSINDDNLLKQIVPSGYVPHIVGDNREIQLANLFQKDNEYYRTFNSYVVKGTTKKGLVFNVYDDDMRNSAISLYRLFQDTRHKDPIVFFKFKKWAKKNLNSDMLDYASRLSALFSVHKSDEKFLPPFVAKPNYFVNGETIMKAMYVKQNKGKISDDVMKIYQVQYDDDKNIIINTNYSGWNIPLEGCDKEIKYFMEDVGLNSYYYGIHLQHPFWMSNEELSEMNARHAEHYYFSHQQLYARYLLEKEHLPKQVSNKKKIHDFCDSDFYPYLMYENGLPFPTRSSILGDKIRDDLAYLKNIDIAIKECLHRGLVIMENGTFIRVSEDNYVDLMTKLIRANLDGVKAAKVIRSIFGYGNNGYTVDKYNPSPSTLHHPQTTLREPVFWFLIRRTLDYYSEYTNNTEAYHISKYETNDFTITNADISKLSTTFEYYWINLNKALESDESQYDKSMTPNVFAKQKRLTHFPFTINLDVESKVTGDVIIRLFLGPQCSVNNCWDIYNNFFLIDCYRHRLNEGFNKMKWSSENSQRYSQTDSQTTLNEEEDESYNIFKFPKSLLLPKGLDSGLNLTLFVMILQDDERLKNTSEPNYYSEVTKEIDSKPLGFPFHKEADMMSESAPNYRFYNVSIFHIKDVADSTNYYSPYLY